MKVSKFGSAFSASLCTLLMSFSAVADQPRDTHCAYISQLGALTLSALGDKGYGKADPSLYSFHSLNASKLDGDQQKVSLFKMTPSASDVSVEKTACSLNIKILDAASQTIGVTVVSCADESVVPSISRYFECDIGNPGQPQQ